MEACIGRNAFSLTDPRDIKIHDRLVRLVGPGPAAFYEDAVFLMNTCDLQSISHLVAHLLREIHSAILDVCLPIAYGQDVPSHTDEPGQQKMKIHAVLKAMDIRKNDPVAVRWLAQSGQGDETPLHARAHRRDLGSPRPRDAEFEQFWADSQALLDHLLLKVESRFLRYVEIIDGMLSTTNPKKKQAALLWKHIPRSFVTLNYLFARLEHPAWIKPLRKAGFFAASPVPARKEDIVTFPPWPEGKYLVRMAPLAPDLVCDVLSSMPHAEDNSHVLADVATAALAMPPRIAVALVPTVEELLTSQYGIAFPDTVGRLIDHVAAVDGGQAALRLAGRLFGLRRETRVLAGEEGQPTREYYSVAARLSNWEYAGNMRAHVPALVEGAGEQAVLMLCSLLRDAVEYDREPRMVESDQEDFSYIWHEAIESDDDQFHALKSVLVSAVRDAAGCYVGEDASRLERALDIMKNHRLTVFRRLALHLLRTRGDLTCQAVECCVMDRNEFSWEMVHEYALLLRDSYTHLRGCAKRTILEWVHEGPDIQAYRERILRWRGQPASDDDVQRYVETWQYRRLDLIKDSLPKKLQKQVSELARKHPDEPRLDAVRPSTIASFFGPSTPKSKAELAALDESELVHFLRTWKDPGGPPDRASTEGLSRELEALVTEFPSKYAAQAQAFRGLHPAYVKALFSGLSQATKDAKDFAWPPVLDLGEWAVAQPRNASERGPDEEAGEGIGVLWGWARSEILRLLTTAFKADSSLPAELRESAWSVIQPITSDPEPSGDREHKRGSDLKPAELSINTPRGEAMHAVIEYALWLYGQRNAGADSGRSGWRGFEEMPEVREVLERHLDPALDPSLAVRSIYGRWFPWLQLLDRRWTEAHVAAIFPSIRTHSALHHAAWDTYIAYCQPYDDVYPLLEAEYRDAAGGVGDADRITTHIGDPDEKVGEHLVVFYLRGLIDLRTRRSPLRIFFAAASDKLRARTLSQLGRWLANDAEPLSAEMVANLQALWEWRLGEALTSSKTSDHREEIGEFGWWYVCDKLPQDWTLIQLSKALQLVGWMEPDDKILERLAHVAETDTQIALDCVGYIARSVTKQWLGRDFIQHVRTILVLGLGRNETRQKAVDIVHVLGAAGYIDEFRDLAQ